MNKDYIIEFLNEFDYPEKNKQAVLEAWEKFSNEKMWKFMWKSRKIFTC